MEQVKLGILWYLVFLMSIVIHETAHAFTGFKLGDRTAFDAGQVSLNPIPHIKREVFGTVIVPIISFILGGWMIGWASAPFDYNWAKKYPKRSAYMSLAGPAANLALVLVSGILISLGYHFEIFIAPESVNFSSVTAASSGGIFSTIATLLSIFFSLNLILFIFNLLPLPSFDGSSLILFFVKEDQIDKAMDFINNPRFTFFSLIIAWNVFEYIFDPIHLVFINFLYPGITYG